MLFFGWAYLYGMGHTKALVFEAEGLATHSPFTLGGIYLTARCFRMEGWEDKLKSRWLMLAFLSCLPFALIGMANYNSPFAFIMAAALFLLFKRHVKAGNWVGWLAPSMFSVYMLHSTKFGLTCMIRLEDVLMGWKWPVYAMFLTVAGFVFAGCVAIDLARRGICRSLRRKVQNGL